jgi:hypothetical protein
MVAALIPLNQWFHLACTYDSTTATNARKIYVNGVIAAQASGNTLAIDYGSNGDWIIGEPNTGGCLLTVDEFVVENVTRNSTYIYDVHAAGPAAVVAADADDVVVFPFTEATGSTVFAPSTGSGNLSVQSGTVTSGAPGIFGRTVHLDAGSTRIVSAAGEWEVTTDRITVSAWLRLKNYRTGAWGQMVYKEKITDNWSGSPPMALTFFSFDTSIFYNQLYTGGTSRQFSLANTLIPLNEWFHAGLTYDGSYLRAYVNGVEQGNMAATGSIGWFSNGRWFIGAAYANPDTALSGACVADLRISKVARSASYLLNQYNKGMGL